jgi:hypothetical protein
MDQSVPLLLNFHVEAVVLTSGFLRSWLYEAAAGTTDAFTETLQVICIADDGQRTDRVLTIWREASSWITWR